MKCAEIQKLHCDLLNITIFTIGTSVFVLVISYWTHTVVIMTLDDTNKYAKAEILLDNEHFGSNAVDSQVLTAQPVKATTLSNTTKTYDSVNINEQKTSTLHSASQGTGRDADMVSHNVQHKRNVVIGVTSGVLLGAVLLGPLGAVAGGFGGHAIVRRRERRWCRRQSRTTTSGPGFPVVTE
jgi:hypothetical protein